MTEYFNADVTAKIRQSELKEIDNLVYLFPDDYKSRSQFIRVAIIREISRRKLKGV